MVYTRDSAVAVAWQEQDTLAAARAAADHARKVGALHVALREGVLR